MIDLIEWLITMEKMAGDFYNNAAEYFKEDRTLYQFLKGAAKDELVHAHLMEIAKSQLDNLIVPSPLFSIKEEMKHNLETPFSLANEGIKNNTLTRERLVDCIIETEFSEWNKIFLFVINSLKQQIQQFYYAAAQIQHHMGRTLHYIQSLPYGTKRVGELQLLERVFEENILIVEDDDLIADFMESLFEEEGNVDVARNGKEGLEKLNQKYYKLIVSDVNMPIMNGMEFFEAANEKFPGMNNRFMFVSGLAPLEVRQFAAQHQITLLPKPSPLEDIMNAALKIIHEVEPKSHVKRSYDKLSL